MAQLTPENATKRPKSNLNFLPDVMASVFCSLNPSNKRRRFGLGPTESAKQCLNHCGSVSLSELRMPYLCFRLAAFSFPFFQMDSW